MPTRIPDFGATAEVALTILVDNHADLLVPATATVKRFTDTPLLAEHGFAALIDLPTAGTRILWDAGHTPIALPENLKRMKIDPTSIQQIALSHGHGDHTAALTELLKALNLKPEAREWQANAAPEAIRTWATGRRLPIIAHPAAFRERWKLNEDGTRVGPYPPPPRAEWEALGAQVILADAPYALAPGCWTTGTIPRASFETAGIAPTMGFRDGDTFARDYIEDDQAIVINLKDKGLIVLSGCAHAGIVNTVNYARAISGVERVLAVIGGFHLASAQAGDLARTVAAIRQLDPSVIAPTHCSGLAATAEFARQMPDAFTQAVVGTTFLF